MLYSIARYLIPLAAALVFGPLAFHFTSCLPGIDGGDQASLLMTTVPMQGVLAALAVFGIALIPGVLAARFVGNRSGLFAAGLVLAWAAWGTGRSDLIIIRSPDAGLGGSPLMAFAIEGAMVGVLGLITAWIIMRVPTMQSALPLVRDPASIHHHLPVEPKGLADSTLPIALGVAAAAGGLAVYLVAQETLKGQTFAAAALAGVAAAAAGRMASQRLSAVVFLAALAILAGASPVLAMLIHKSAQGAVHAAQAGKLFVLARPLPLDWLAGAFIGVPMGVAWAGSMIDKHQPAPVPAKR